jgi:hypothetical protein
MNEAETTFGIADMEFLTDDRYRMARTNPVVFIKVMRY